MRPKTGLVMAHLEIDRSELIEGMAALARHTKPAKAGEAIVRFEAGQITIAVGGGETSASASGRWPGEARVAGSFVLALARHAPADDPLPIWVEADALHIASLSVPCAWQHIGAAQLEIPIGATLAEILRTGIDQTDESLEHSGIRKRVEEAREKRRDLVERAVAILKALDVRADDVERLVDTCLRTSPDQRSEK